MDDEPRIRVRGAPRMLWDGGHGSVIVRGNATEIANRGGFSPSAVDSAMLNVRQLVKRMLESERGVPRKLHKYKGKKYPDSFLGNELVDWLVRQHEMLRSQAESVCRRLSRAGFITCTKGEALDYDDSAVYVFMEEAILSKKLAEEERILEEHVTANASKLAVAVATLVVESQSFRTNKLSEMGVVMLLDGTIISCFAIEGGSTLPLLDCPEKMMTEEELLSMVNSTAPDWSEKILISHNSGPAQGSSEILLSARTLGRITVRCPLDLGQLQSANTQKGFIIGPVDSSDVLNQGNPGTEAAIRASLSILHKSIINMQLRLYVVEQALAFCRPIEYDVCIQSVNAMDLPRRKVSWRGRPLKDSQLAATNLHHFRSFVCNEPGWKDLLGTPEYNLDSALTGVLAGDSISNYPTDPNNAHICDTYLTKMYEHQTHLVLADGCNWGLAPANAARFAALGFMGFLEEMTNPDAEILETTQDFASMLYQAAYEAHRNIAVRHQLYLKNHNLDMESPPGTTTLLGGVILELDAGDRPAANTSRASPFIGIFVSIGDCKAYRVSASDGSFLDLTKGVRPEGLDAADPGGRLGPYVDENPDIRNLRLMFVPLNPGDQIVLVTDGVYDNFDAIMRGIPVEDSGLTHDSWDNASNLELDRLKEKFAAELLREKEATEPEEIVDVFLNYSRNLTEPSRQFMVEHPFKKLPDDYKVYPGKMDHATVLVFKVVFPASLEMDIMRAAQATGEESQLDSVLPTIDFTTDDDSDEPKGKRNQRPRKKKDIDPGLGGGGAASKLGVSLRRSAVQRVESRTPTTSSPDIRKEKRKPRKKKDIEARIISIDSQIAALTAEKKELLTELAQLETEI